MTLLITLGVFFLLFYSTPYWTGAEMEDLMHNGVYHAFYIFCSKVGFWAYQLIETLANFLCGRKNSKAHLLSYTLLTLSLLTCSIIGLKYLYEYLFQEIFTVGDGLDVSNEHSAVSRFSDFLILFKLIANYHNGTFLGFFSALGKALLMCIAYILGTIIYYSFLYGLLCQKVVPIFNSNEEDEGESSSLLYQCINGVKGAIRKICYLRYFKIPGTISAFLLIVAVYSAVQVVINVAVTSQSLISGVIDSTGITDLLLNFLITFVLGKVVNYIGIPLYRILSKDVQHVLDSLSGYGRKWVKDEKIRREKWANEHDFIRTSDGPVKKMHLE